MAAGMTGLTDPRPVEVDELHADYVAALRRAARAGAQQLERRATITRRQFLALSWHGEPEAADNSLQRKSPPPSEAVGSTVKEQHAK